MMGNQDNGDDSVSPVEYINTESRVHGIHGTENGIMCEIRGWVGIPHTIKTQ